MYSVSYRAIKNIIKNKMYYNDSFHLSSSKIPHKLLMKKHWLETAEQFLGEEINGIYYNVEHNSDESRLMIEFTGKETINDDNFCRINYSSQNNKSSRYIYIAKKLDMIEFFSFLSPSKRKKNKMQCEVEVNGNTLTFKKNWVIKPIEYTSVYSQDERIQDLKNIRKFLEMSELTPNQKLVKGNKMIYEYRTKYKKFDDIDYLNV